MSVAQDGFHISCPKKTPAVTPYLQRHRPQPLEGPADNKQTHTPATTAQPAQTAPYPAHRTRTRSNQIWIPQSACRASPLRASTARPQAPPPHTPLNQSPAMKPHNETRALKPQTRRDTPHRIKGDFSVKQEGDTTRHTLNIRTVLRNHHTEHG